MNEFAFVRPRDAVKSFSIIALSIPSYSSTCQLWITQLLLLIRTTSPVTDRAMAIAVFCGAGEDERRSNSSGRF